METTNEQQQKRIVIGLLAHVDAGKTTLAESLLVEAKAIRRQGRVDHRDSFLDTDSIERARGVTVLTKPAVFAYHDTVFTLLDTPGHTDFGAEAERSLAVLDAAVLLISASEGIQAHTRTLWQLLRSHRIPVFVFINKTDLPHPPREALLASLSDAFAASFADFTTDETDAERIAESSEALLESWLTDGTLPEADIALAIEDRALFPVVFGAALRNEGTARLLALLCRFARPVPIEPLFGARVIKVSFEGADRLTWLKITGGCLKVKDTLSNIRAGIAKDAVWAEKVNEIRLYSGQKVTALSEAAPGCVCAVTGLTKTYAGEGLGFEMDAALPVLTPVISYAIRLPEAVNKADALQKLKRLSEEEPLLQIQSDEETGELRAALMGQLQAEVVIQRAMERYGLAISFGTGRVLYRETIENTVMGIGHFEPLRHYAHVELRLSPAPRGSGLQFRSEVSSDVLSQNWQRLILTHLAERVHRGVLTGAPVTDLLITLTYGKAHLKHTEGGDFRQATYRAVRQGLMQAQSVLLEPYYRFSLSLPAENLGRAMTDIRRMCGELDAPELSDAEAVLTGVLPVSAAGDYMRELTAYTHGLGRLALSPGDYRPCHNADEVIAAAAYDPEADLRHTPDSVFCAGGAGFTVKWNEVAAHMKAQRAEAIEKKSETPITRPRAANADLDAELRAIFERTYGPVKDTSALYERRKAPPADTPTLLMSLPPERKYILVDGYNILFAWERLQAAAKAHIATARELLIASLVNYQALRGCNLILVFDAYKVAGGVEHIEQVGGMYVVYTREAEIADVYIEKVAKLLEGQNVEVRVATSDALEQLIIMGKGALRVSARAFIAELEQVEGELTALLEKNNAGNGGRYHIWEIETKSFS
ncbi:MAG: NYN domain-containing protein [Clostridia bacterium]|nr:NYN domain-containing protein [Clostridia bacterium]